MKQHNYSVLYVSLDAYSLLSLPGLPGVISVPLCSDFTSTHKHTHWRLDTSPHPPKAHNGFFGAKSHGLVRLSDIINHRLLVETLLSFHFFGVTPLIFLLSTPHSIPVSLAGFSSLVSSWGSFPKVPTRVPVSCFVASSCWLSFPPATVYISVTPKLMSHSRSLLLAQDLDIHLFTVPLSAHTQCTNGISTWLVPPSHSSPLSPLASLLFISLQFCVSFLCLKCISFQY